MKKLLRHYHKLPKKVQKIISMSLLVTTFVALGSFIYLFGPWGKVSAVWFDDNWHFRRQLTLDNSAQSSTLTEFPVLVTLNSSRIDYNNTQDGGQDIRFTDCFNGKLLSYEIEKWDESGNSYVWVKVPSLLATNSNCIYIYYGNKSAVDAQKGTDVWSNAYSHVYHFANVGAVNNGKNSVTGSSAGSSFGAGYTDTAGKIGRGFANSTANTPFQTTDDRRSSTALTVEAWVDPPTTAVNWTDFASQGWAVNGWDLYQQQTNSQALFGVAKASAQQNAKTTGGLTDDFNNYLVGTYDSSGDDVVRIYHNGTLGSTTGTGDAYATDVTSNIVALVNGNAAMDELRISSVSRSADWIAAQYASMNDSMITFGSQEKAPSPVGYWKFDEGTGTSVKDSMGISAAGTFTNSPAWQTDNMCISGKCILFTGGSFQSISIADANNPVRPSGNTLTVSSWYKRQTASSTGTIAQKGASGASGWTVSIGISPCTTNQVKASKLGVVDICLDGVPADTNWHHMAVVYDTTGVTLYIDGLAKGTSSNTSSFTATTSNLVIGYGDAGGYFSGFIDEFKIYDYARSAAQIKVDYNSQAAAAANGSGSILGAEDNASLSNSLTGYWKMDEASGDAIDYSGNGYTATNTSTTISKGKFGNARTFASTAKLQASNSLVTGTGDFTLSAWINASSLGTNVIMGNYGTSSCSTGLQMYLSSGRLRAYIGTPITGATTILTNTWYHVAATRKDGAITLFINGVRDGTGTLTGSVGSNCNWAIGNGPNYTSEVFTGKIDEARVYNRALSGSEISQLYNYAPGPVGYWDFEEGVGSTVNDHSTYANTGTWEGTLLGRQWTVGKYGKAGKFNGTNNDVTVADATNLQVSAGGAVTLSAWIKTQSSDTSIIAKNYDGFGNKYIMYISFGVLVIGFQDESANGVDNVGFVSNVNDGTWHHVASTFDGTTGNWKIYKDGVLAASGTGTPTTDPMGSTGSLLIGYTDFAGSIDEARVYNYERTAKQIVQDMNAGKPASATGSQQAYWKFDDGYGTTANNSGASGALTKGTLTNMAAPATSTSGWSQSGKIGKALSFDGSNDYVAIGSNPTPLQITGDLTLSAWVNLTTNNAVHDIIAKKGASGQFGYRLHTDTTGKLTMEVSGSGSNTAAATSSATLSTATWYHVVGVYSSGTSTSIKLYINGRADGSSTTAVPSSIFNSSANVNIGGENSGASNLMSGKIDEAKIYSGILTPQEILIDYNKNASQVLGSGGTSATGAADNANDRYYCPPGDTTATCGPVSEWQFEQRAGTSANDTGSIANNTLTLSGTLIPFWTPGKIGSALEYRGSTSYATVADPADGSLDFGTNSFTISAWFKTNTASANPRIISKGMSGNTDGYEMQLYSSNNTVIFGIGGGGVTGNAIQFNGSTAVTDNNWHHVVVVVNQTTDRIYMWVDGTIQTLTKISTTCGSYTTTTEVDISACTSATASSTNSFDVGRNQITNGEYFTGRIDQVKVYNYPLSTAQVMWDYNKGAPIGWWKLDECQGTTANDSSGNNNRGTITIGGTGTYTAPGSCNTSSASSAWYNGATGKRNYSLAFDGTDDYAEVASSSKLDSTSGTWSGWVKTSQGTSGYPLLLSRADSFSSYNGILIFQNQTTGKIRAQIKNGSTEVLDLTAGNAINDGNWHHFALTFNGTGTAYLYMDGKLLTSGTPSGSWSFNSQVLRLAKATDSFWSYYTGQLDDIRLFNYPLTSTQIKSLYNDGAVRFGPVSGTP